MLQLKVPQEVEAEIEAVDSVPEVAEVVEVEEVDQVEEEETKKNGLHSPSSEDLLNTEISFLSRRSIPTPSQSRKPQSSIDSLPTPRLSSLMKSCASFPSKSKLRLVKN